MDQPTNYKYKIDYFTSNDTSLIQPTQTIVKKRKYKKCNGCNKTRKILESHQICHVCFKAKELKLSGNKIIDDFIKYTQTNYVKKGGKMVFVPHDQLKNIEFIAEGGFSKIYKATWIDGSIKDWENFERNGKMTVALKELNNSKNINFKELNEVKYPICNSFGYKSPYKLLI